jgi:phosphoribosyl 1,2-cyclic phosphodiesterase
MDVEFWGVRGSAPVSGKDKLKYGGHTPCAMVTGAAGEVLIIDAGTGIKKLGEKLMAEAGAEKLHCHLLLTHFHLDHIIGLPFFAPLYFSRTQVTFYSVSAPQETEKYLRGVMSGRYFPVDFRETAAQKKFVKVAEDSFLIGNLKISQCPLHHPQGSAAYKIEEKKSGVVFATDTEPPEQGLDERLAAFINGVTYFIYDATFTPEEYLVRQGWGHSTWLEGTKLARRGRVRNLVLSHFNPDHSDRLVDEMLKRARKEFGRTSAAREKRRLKIC